eukprot:151764-Amphidinium_carterae.1
MHLGGAIVLSGTLLEQPVFVDNICQLELGSCLGLLLLALHLALHTRHGLHHPEEMNRNERFPPNMSGSERYESTNGHPANEDYENNLTNNEDRIPFQQTTNQSLFAILS